MMSSWFTTSLQKQAELMVSSICKLRDTRAGRPATLESRFMSEWILIACKEPGSVITQEEIDILPKPAQRYFALSRVVGKPRPRSFSIIMEGRIRNGPTSRWMPIRMRQFNRVDHPSRIVYIESPGTPMAGIDSFVNGQGRMLIRMFGFVTLSDVQGREMSQSALVTFLNDLVLCPAAYFSVPLEWKHIDGQRCALRLSWAGMTVTAELEVDETGRLRNWTSADRYAEVKGKILPDRWSTPFSEHVQEIEGCLIPSSGKGFHDYDGNPYVYVELDRIHDLLLNATGLPA